MFYRTVLWHRAPEDGTHYWENGFRVGGAQFSSSIVDRLMHLIREPGVDWRSTGRRYRSESVMLHRYFSGRIHLFLLGLCTTLVESPEILSGEKGRG